MKYSNIMRFVVMYLAMVITISPLAIISVPDSSPSAVERWFRRLPNASEKLTKLHFYFQDQVSGPNPTAVEVARASITASSPHVFGLVRVFDDPLTVTGSPSSKTIGYGQGIYAGASQHDTSLLFTFNFYFTDGKYDGSTLSIQGRNPLGNTYREMSVVGGSGIFRLARGIAVGSTYWANATTQDGIVEFTVYVLHYDSPAVSDEGYVEDM
ncbi:OLC1v1012495C1 [Oldenlandia corymbosa var. corymbosa]|uniref:Dirigent protein n=1 Tax=Oldenlandia corymbosa var. corymbosa TaxID=529605 RepID=A0AAV1DZG1_OLDCO|nr:OLC1v1012495C1 [Oldenlandia corymbosa var. corymbosa]